MGKRIFLFVFVLIAVAEILVQLFNRQELNVFIKPLIVLSLMGYYFQNAELKNRLFVFVLIFCWLGDVFLLFDHINQLYFMAGLGSFLIAHILLIFLYRQLRTTQGSGLNGPQKIRAAFPIILIGTGLVTVLYPSLGGLTIPVMMYALALTLMVLQSVFRYGFTTSASFWNVFGGAMFFMISDSMLAINKFMHPFSYAGSLVIATYIAAVYFITQGVIAHAKK
ncbi:MAG: lysoplasmalogenase [Cyclobacteriaceae bacterium]